MRPTRHAPLLLALLASCSIAKLPPAPPRRVLELPRRLPVVVESEPAGLRLLAVGSDGQPGAPLGSTPRTIDELEVTKELWKHGELQPPPRSSEPFHAERAEDPLGTRRSQAGAPLVWSVFVQPLGGGAPVRHDLALEARELEESFSRGRIVFRILPPAVR